MRRVKVAVFVASLLPAAALVYGVVADTLGANPIDAITDETGTWTLRFLVLTLLVTPLRRWTGWNGAIRFRRMLGLFAFFYGTLHFLTWAILDRFVSLEFPDGAASLSGVRIFTAAVGDDILMRKFITVGFLAWVTMLPLALTSTTGMIRR